MTIPNPSAPAVEVVAPAAAPVTPITPNMSPEAIADALTGPVTPAVTPAPVTEVKPEVKPEVESSNDDELTEATYTKEQVTAMMAKRYGRLKEDAIKTKADELAKEYRTAADDAKTEAASLKRENEALKLAKTSGHSFEVLYSTNLSGDDLVKFVESLDKEYSSKSRISGSTVPDNSLASRLNKTVSEHSGSNANAWKSTFSAALKGEK